MTTSNQTNAIRNVAVGNYALEDLTGATEQCTAVGYEAGMNITTGDNNTCIGYAAGDTITDGGSNCIIGTGADVSVGAGTNQVVLGNGAAGHGNNITDFLKKSRVKLFTIPTLHLVKVSKVIHARAITGPASAKTVKGLHLFRLHSDLITQRVLGIDWGVRVRLVHHVNNITRFLKKSSDFFNFFILPAIAFWWYNVP